MKNNISMHILFLKFILYVKSCKYLLTQIKNYKTVVITHLIITNIRILASVMLP